MVAYNFKSQFADDVESGKKRQTIRANGKRPHARPGQELQLYTGMRTKGCRKLKDTICLETLPVSINRTLSETRITMVIGGVEIVGYQLEDMAHKDGFKNSDDLFTFFEETHGLPFEGTLISW